MIPPTCSPLLGDSNPYGSLKHNCSTLSAQVDLFLALFRSPASTLGFACALLPATKSQCLNAAPAETHGACLLHTDSSAPRGRSAQLPSGVLAPYLAPRAIFAPVFLCVRLCHVRGPLPCCWVLVDDKSRRFVALQWFCLLAPLLKSCRVVSCSVALPHVVDKSLVTRGRGQESLTGVVDKRHSL